MGEKYILAHDMGTSGNKAILITVHGEIIATTKEKYPLYYPKPGFAEHDPLEWWDAICNTTRRLLKETSIKPEEVVGITMSSMMQTLIPVDHQGNPLTRAMTWLDVRSAEILSRKLWTPPRIIGYNIFKLLRFLIITGGTPGHTGKDQIGEILWLREYQPEIFAQTYKFIDAKDFILYQLTGNFVTSVDLATVWWLLDSRKNRNQWHSGLCKLAGITPAQLAEVKESGALVGYLTAAAGEKLGLVTGTPVINGAGDLTASALGSGAVEEGELHVRIGSSGGVGGHFKKRKIDIAHYAGCIGSANPREYYLGLAEQDTAGICLEWIKDNVIYHQNQLIEETQVEEVYQLFDQLAEKAPAGANGLIFTPWIYGERCPLDDDTVRAGLFNLGLNHTRQHIFRAVLEGIAFNLRWAMEIMENLYQPVKEMRMVGGGAKSDIWCQIMADVTNRIIHQVTDPDLGAAKGVALLASKTLGYIESFSAIKQYVKIKNSYQPNPENRKLYDRLFKEFKNLYKQNKHWYRRMNR